MAGHGRPRRRSACPPSAGATARAEQRVPDAEDRAVIAVGVRPPRMMVHPMDRRRHDQPAEQTLDRRRQPRVGVVEDGGHQDQAPRTAPPSPAARRAGRSRRRGPARTAPPRRNGSARHSRCRAARHNGARRGSAKGAGSRDWRDATSRARDRAAGCRRRGRPRPRESRGAGPSENPSAQTVIGRTSSGDSRRFSPKQAEIAPEPAPRGNGGVAEADEQWARHGRAQTLPQGEDQSRQRHQHGLEPDQSGNIHHGPRLRKFSPCGPSCGPQSCSQIPAQMAAVGIEQDTAAAM